MSLLQNITLIDYGAGNLLNVQRAFEHCGAKVNIATTAKQIAQADRLVFPGVGAFPEAMMQLRQQGLLDAIRENATNKPFLGICLGMQMMLEESDEFSDTLGITAGLGLIKGRVEKLPKQSTSEENLIVPNMGWWQINPSNQQGWQGSLLAGVSTINAFYFVHSYYANLTNKQDKLAEIDFGGHKITAVIQQNNLIGCQFHPEKSGEAGLKLIKSFLKI